MQKTRRDFLKTMGAGSALLLSGCSSLDKIVLGDVDSDGQKVLVVGAGIAGLTAAYELKKRGIPFRLIEGSSRVGGRLWTLRNINISSQSADLGGENIEWGHDEVRSLVGELGLRFNELNPILGYSWVPGSSELNAKEWLKEAAKLEGFFKKWQMEAYGSSVQYMSQKSVPQFPVAQQLDRLSTAEFLDEQKKNLSAWMSPFIKQVLRSHWGAETEQVSALHMLHWSREAFSIQKRKFLRIDGGSEVLAQALYDRIAGVIPDRFVKFQHRLKRIEKSGDNWNLIFETPKGIKEYSSRAVICTLPPAIYPEINGWENLESSGDIFESIKTVKSGAQGKLVMSFVDRYWKSHSVLGGGGEILSDLDYMNLSHAGSIPALSLGAVHGLLQAQLGGAPAEKINPESVATIVNQLRSMDPKAASYENIYHLQNWKAYPWSKGGRSFAAPGYYGAWSEDIFNLKAATWAMAGDFCSLKYMGSMNGAIETARMAVDKVLKVV